MPDLDGRLDPVLAASLDSLDGLIESFEGDPDPGVRERAVELLRTVDLIHRAGLTRLAAYLDELGGDVRARLLGDPAVRLLWELYELLPAEPRPVSFIPLDEVEVLPAGRR